MLSGARVWLSGLEATATMCSPLSMVGDTLRCSLGRPRTNEQLHATQPPGPEAYSHGSASSTSSAATSRMRGGFAASAWGAGLPGGKSAVERAFPYVTGSVMG